MTDSGDAARESPWFTTYDSFVTFRAPLLLRQAQAVLLDDHQARDAVAVVLGKVYTRWSRISRLEAPDAYIRRMVFNECNSFRRRVSTRREKSYRPEELPERSIEDASEAYARRDEIIRCLKSLSLRQRSVLVLRYYEDLGDAEIAQILGISEGTVRYHASIGMNSMKRMLGEGMNEAEK